MNQSTGEFEQALRQVLAKWGIPTTPQQESLLGQHFRAMVEANRQINLTRITDLAEAVCKHYADSLALLLWHQSQHGDSDFSAAKSPTGNKANPVRLLDVGTGAGFPAVPLAVMRPDWQVVALDATQKKVGFVAGYVGQARLENIRAEHGHSDHWECTEKFDFVTTRAVSDLGRVIRSCKRFLRHGGCLIAYKTAQLAESELEGARRTVGDLKLVMDDPFPYELHCGDDTLRRALYTVRIA